MARIKSASLLLPYFALVIVAVAVPAHAEVSFIAKSTCDPHAGTVRIEQVWTEEPGTYQAEAGSEIMPMDSLVKYVSKSPTDDYRVKVRDWNLVCTLGQTRYELSISPWNWNNHVGGMCGGGSPNVELTVRRDRQVLMSDLVFSGYCDNTWNEKLNISWVTFSEVRKTATFAADNGEIPKPISIEHPYKDLGTLTRATLWQDLVDKQSAANPTVAEAHPRSQQVKTGRYVRKGDSGTLVIRTSRSSELAFEINSIGANGHSCSVSGIVRGTVGYPETWQGSGADSHCRISFDRDDDGVKIATTTAQECRAYCGMRADFAGLYKTVSAQCTRHRQQLSRNSFLKAYRSGNFTAANQILVDLLSQCAYFINWTEADGVRNDLALSQFRGGDAHACLKTLSDTQAAKYPNEDALKEAFPPGDFESYITVAKATWHNKELCERNDGGK